MADRVMVSRDDRERPSPGRRYVFVNHHALRRTMAGAVDLRREVKGAPSPIMLTNPAGATGPPDPGHAENSRSERSKVG
jgi:hypothetical protein